MDEFVVFRRRAYLPMVLLATGPLVACSDAEIFDRVAGPQAASLQGAAWPRLESVPPTPPVGVYTEAAPDPAIGDATQIELAIAAETAETRRKTVEGPVE